MREKERRQTVRVSEGVNERCTGTTATTKKMPQQEEREKSANKRCRNDASDDWRKRERTKNAGKKSLRLENDVAFSRDLHQ